MILHIVFGFLCTSSAVSANKLLFNPIPVGRSQEKNTISLREPFLKYASYMARLVPSPYALYPTLCTAICIDERIFFVPYLCVEGAQRSFRQLRIVYRDKVIQLEALILPDPDTYTPANSDDLALIVTVSEKRDKGFFDAAQLHEPLERPLDTSFTWFEVKWRAPQYNDNIQIIAFVDKDLNYDTVSLFNLTTDTRWPAYETELRTLNVTIGIELCSRDTILRHDIEPEFPCALACPANVKCSSMLMALGAGVFYDDKLIGVTTWINELELITAIGICMPNSKRFMSDFYCAKLIRDASRSFADKPLGYQKLCDQ